MAWHTLPADAPKQDVDAFEKAALARYERRRSPRCRRGTARTYFAHIWGGGYAAGYYAYLWSEVLDDDAYYWFKEHGGMTRANGQRFREMILSRGGSQRRRRRCTAPSAAATRRCEPLLEERGLAAAKP